MKPSKESIVKELKRALREPFDGCLWEKARPRWMPAVLLRRQTIRDILLLLEAIK